MTNLLLLKVAICALFATTLSFQMEQKNNTVTTEGQPSTANGPVTTTQPPTTLTPEQECDKLNGTGCDGCVKNPKCLFCFSDHSCKAYPVGHILPRTEDCAGGLSQARWGQCWINFEALIIAIGCIGGVIVLSFIICICCCCCRSKSSKKYERQEARLERQKEERSAKASEKRIARQARNDEIRQKYGLVREDNPYQRFDA